MSAAFAAPYLFGAYMRYGANREADKRRDRIQRAMEAYGIQKANEGLAASSTYIDTLRPQDREAGRLAAEAKVKGSLESTVEATRAFEAPQIAGKLSPEFAAAREAAAQSVAERTRRAIEQLTAMQAPGEASLVQRKNFHRAAGIVDAASQARGNVGRAYLTDIEGVRPDRRTIRYADLLQGVGAAGMYS